MVARKLWEAGFKDLVSVIPPGAPLSPNSSIKPEQTGKIPGLRGSKGWYGYAWTQGGVSVEALERWGSSIGLKADNFPGVDIDSSSPAFVKLAEGLATEMLGPAPFRWGRKPRALLVYRTSEPFGRMALTFDVDGERHMVEVLGKGKQYLVYGKHPSGVDYEWADSPLWEWPLEKIPSISVEHVRAYLTAIQEKLKAAGVEAELIGTGDVTGEADAPAQEPLRAPSLTDLRECVESLPNTNEFFPDRDDYIKVGCAIKAAWPDDDGDAFNTWAEWCERWTGGTNEPDTVAEDWGRIRPPFRIGWEWLKEQASIIGSYNAAGTEFKALKPPREAPAPPPPQTVCLNEERPASDEALIRLLAARLKGSVLHVARVGWHLWDGNRWAPDERDVVLHDIRQACYREAQSFMEKAMEVEDDKARAHLIKRANRLQTATFWGAAMKALAAHRDLAVKADDMDAKGWLLCTPDGTYDLRTGERKDPCSCNLITRQTRVAPDFKSPAPVWERFLQEATEGDADLALFLQKQMGYALTGDTSEDTMTFMIGPGGNGKSVFIEAVAYAMGDYATVAAMDTFTRARGDRIPADLASLRGARLVYSEETTKGKKWDEERIKNITGGSSLKVRHLYGKFFEYTPSFKLFVIGNFEPEIEGFGDAMIRRINMVPFTHKPAEIDRQLSEKLEGEAPQILAWMMEGCRLWQEEGMNRPDTVVFRTEEYFGEEDTFQRWYDDCCVKVPDRFTPSQDLWRSWNQWCYSNNEKPGSTKHFYREIANRARKWGVESDRQRYGPKAEGGERSPKMRGYTGIALKEESMI